VDKLMNKTNGKVTVKLIGEDGNAFFILGTVVKALKKNGFGHLVDEYKKEAMSSDYNNLLVVTMDYVKVE
jgi:hypothetical protein